MNLGDEMELIYTIDKIKKLEFPEIFKKGGRYENSTVEIIEGDFDKEALTKQIIDEFKNLKVNFLLMHGRIWELACGSDIKKVYIFDIVLEDIQTRVKIEDMKLDIMYEMEGEFNKNVSDLKHRIITMTDKQLVRG